MGSRVASLVVCAALAASAASWAVWLRARPAPPASRAGAITAARGGPAVSPGARSPGGAPTAADEGDGTTRPVGSIGDGTRRARRASPATRPDPVPRAAAHPSAPPSRPAAKPETSPRPTSQAGQAGERPRPTAGSTGAGDTGPATDAAPGGSASSAAPGASVPGPGSGGAGAPSAAPEAPARAPVLTPPKVLATPGTLYPGDAFRLTVRRQDLGAAAVIEGSEGVVAVRALILATGEVRSVDVTGSSGSDALDRAAVEAVRGWRFAPATRDGAPIDAFVTLRIRYVVR